MKAEIADRAARLGSLEILDRRCKRINNRLRDPFHNRGLGPKDKPGRPEAIRRLCRDRASVTSEIGSVAQRARFC